MHSPKLSNLIIKLCAQPQDQRCITALQPLPDLRLHHPGCGCARRLPGDGGEFTTVNQEKQEIKLCRFCASPKRNYLFSSKNF